MITNVNYFSDCSDIMKDIPDKSIDLFLEDMPYNTTSCKWEYEINLEEYWNLRLPKLKTNGAFILFGVEPFSSKVRMSNLKMYKIDWAWEKDSAGNFMNTKKHPFKIFENVMIFSNGDHKFNPIRISRSDASLKRHKVGKNNLVKMCKRIDTIEHIGNFKYIDSILSSDGLKNPHNIVYFPKYDTNRYAGIRHPTRKPIALFEYFINTYSNENDIIFDGYSGSGTTAIACIRTNRQYIICENHKPYFDIQTKRIQDELDSIQLLKRM